MKPAQTIFSETFFQRFCDVFSPYLESVGIDPLVLEKADIEIPEERYIALWEAVGQSSPNIGLEIGSQTVTDDIGALGHALHCAPSVGKALEIMHRFVVVFAQKSRIDFEITSKHVTVDYQIDDPTIIYRRQDAEFAVANILRHLNLITDNCMGPSRVDFEHEKPADTSVHKRLFGCSVYFNQPTNRIYFPAEILEVPVRGGNERLYQALLPYLERQRDARTEPTELLPRITHIIAANLTDGTPSLEAVSGQLGLASRTLQRRLNALGIEFSFLLENVRRDLAMSYMKSSKYSATEVAMLIGYADSASFSRAFRRWAGQTPQQYRAVNAH
jgi:AraC-like DNA-binding protein